MTLHKFVAAPRNQHRDYDMDGAINPVAPEYTIGDVLSGSLYRVAVLGMRDAEVDLRKLRDLAARQQDVDAWTHILQRALKAPPRQKSDNDDILPVVPTLAAHGAVLGSAPRSRWLPGKLVLAALGADSDGAPRPFFDLVAASLAVGPTDEIAARYLERTLQGSPNPTPPLLQSPPASFWRRLKGDLLTPGERLARDVKAIIGIKHLLPRYQWHVLLQSILRLGVSTYQLWLCMLHEQLWDALCGVVDGSESVPTASAIETAWCIQHGTERPLLELGEDATGAIRAHMARYAVARTGINAVMHALEDASKAWGKPLAPGTNGVSPAEGLEKFLLHVWTHRDAILKALQAAGLGTSLRRAAQSIADADADYVSAEQGPTKGMREFLRYTLGQLGRKRGHFESVDQAYFTRPANGSTNAKQVVHPGSTTLVALSVCTNASGLPASMQDFAHHLREYGIYSPLGSLSSGSIGRELEQLGLTVETPDAGGGRLLCNPFFRISSGEVL